ncbi:MAG: CHAP domain-containing protein [Novosphingobium sp.]|nr:CHAP domain-containing protein [Novosphingobium sp.]
MKGYRIAIMLGLAGATVAPASARSAIDDALAGMDDDRPIAAKSPDYLECVPYARQLSGIQIFGDAHTWWKQASGRYATGHAPRVGAVMAMEPYANSQLGHVATVSKVVDSRTILVSHANWSPIEGQRGRIEKNVTVLDVSPDNDWSEVRVWYQPIHNLGTTHWPVSGFIYNDRPGKTATASKKKGRRSDPIGDIIAGAY